LGLYIEYILLLDDGLHVHVVQVEAT